MGGPPVDSGDPKPGGAPGKIAGSLVTPDQAGQADHLTVSRAFTVAN